jgi:Lysozyme like domain
VTTWGPVGIAQFAQRAGVANSDLVDVVALALAATRGQDHFHYLNPLDKTSERWGLWALPQPEAKSLAGLSLYDPQMNADQLARLARFADGALSWHESYGPGGHEAWVPFVQSVLSSSHGKGPAETDGGFYDKLERAKQRAWAMAGRVRNG